MQRSWGRTVPGVLEERGGGPCGWNRVRGVVRSEGEDMKVQRKRRLVMQDLVGRGEDLGFSPKEGRHPGGLWAEEGHHLTSSVCSEKDRLSGVKTMPLIESE